jgi:hypothetical protein
MQAEGQLGAQPACGDWPERRAGRDYGPLSFPYDRGFGRKSLHPRRARGPGRLTADCPHGVRAGWDAHMLPTCRQCHTRLCRHVDMRDRGRLWRDWWGMGHVIDARAKEPKRGHTLMQL